MVRQCYTITQLKINMIKNKWRLIEKTNFTRILLHSQLTIKRSIWTRLQKYVYSFYLTFKSWVHIFVTFNGEPFCSRLYLQTQRQQPTVINAAQKWSIYSIYIHFVSNTKDKFKNRKNIIQFFFTKSTRICLNIVPLSSKNIFI